MYQRLIILLLSTIAATSYGVSREDYYQIYPTRFEAQTEHLWHNSFTILNGDNNAVRLSIAPERFDVGERGPYQADTSLIPTKDRHFDLTPYLAFSPRYLALRPFAHKAINVRVTLPKDLTPGTYWTRLKFSMLTPHKNPLFVKHHKGNFAAELIPLIDESVPLYIDVNESQRSLDGVKVTCTISKSHHFVHLAITNPTNWAFEPVYTLQTDKIKDLTARSFPVMPQSKATRQIVLLGRKITSNIIHYKLPYHDKEDTLTCKSV